ncbi:MAG: transposase [Chromatiales bacterium]
MPRKLRMYLAGVPCHVVQRGNNRCATFFDGTDYRHYLSCLLEASKRYRVSVHAYVLMTNHVHLLMTPSDAIGVSRLMQSLGRRYVQYINYQFRRSGTLWEGRHKASLVQAERYLLTCYRYIEFNPVRAAMVYHPGEYRWSSYRWHAYGEPDPVVCDHHIYNALGMDVSSRQQCYRDLFAAALDPLEVHAIRQASSFSMPLGNERFREEVEEALGRRTDYAARGQPRSDEPATRYPD